MDFFDVNINDYAKDLAMECLNTGWISEGKRVKQFEELLQNRGFTNPVTVNSGTAALHLALTVAGIGKSDEVIIPSQTFVATGLAVLMTGARPVFADVDLKTGNILPSSVKRMITQKTRAVIPVHWGGYPCEMDELSVIAKENNIFVLEDAAHALGARYMGKPIGSLSRFTAFSFQAIKHCTTGDGGVICCQSEDDARKARTLRWFGIDREKAEPSILGERSFDIDTLGYKYHMNDIAASIGIGNLQSFPERLRRHREIGKFYRAELKKLPGINLFDCRSEDEHAFWFFSFLVDNRNDFIRMMAENKIPVSVVHQGIHKYSIFNSCKKELDNQRIFDGMHIALPIHSRLHEEDIARIVSCIKKGW